MLTQLAGGFEYPAVNRAIARFEKRLKIDRELQKKIKKKDGQIVEYLDLTLTILTFEQMQPGDGAKPICVSLNVDMQIFPLKGE